MEEFMENLKKSMSPEQLENYRKKGESFFSNFDFDSGMMNKVDNSYIYILASLRSGLNVDDLDSDEKEIMFRRYGKDWEKRIIEIISEDK